MVKLLIVDDDKKTRDVIKEYASLNNYIIDESDNGIEAVQMCKNNEYDVILLDVMMPKLDGFSACKEIRKFSIAPIIMLSARCTEYDKLFGFELGIDDYITKPFSPNELMARVTALIKRISLQATSTAKEGPKTTLSFDGLTIDLLGRNVYVDGEKISLTPKEYELLSYLAENRNIALSRGNIIQTIWGYDLYNDDRTIDTHIKNLRSNLGSYRDFIVTLRGVGYKFEYTKD